MPASALSWLGVTSPSSSGLARALQSGARVQLGLSPTSALTSPVVQGYLSGSATLSTAVSNALTAGLPKALIALPSALQTALALGYGSVASLASGVALDPAMPVAALVVSPTPSMSPAPSPSPGATGGLVVGILAGAALFVYFFAVSVVACCVTYTCCAHHTQCKERYKDRSIWCCYCHRTPTASTKESYPQAQPYLTPTLTLKEVGLVPPVTAKENRVASQGRELADAVVGREERGARAPAVFLLQPDMTTLAVAGDVVTLASDPTPRGPLSFVKT